MAAIMRQIRVDEIEAPLFHSAHAAVRFAMSVTGRPERPAMNSRADGPPPLASKGLGGLDGAAQAGIIRSKMKALGELADAILIARAAPHMTNCECRRPCCSGRMPNREWVEAIEIIGHYVVKHSQSKAIYRIRNAILRNIYGDISTKKKIAESQEISIDTVMRHYRHIQHWLSRPTNGVAAPDPQAWMEIEIALREAGIVGD